ncbi:hypothetical protein GCM10027185_58610 [Spirosoma pulveris]
MSSLDEYRMDQLADDQQEATLEEQLQLLTQALYQLSSQEAGMLQLTYELDLPTHQIANQLGLKERAVKMRLRRSRQKAYQYDK